MENKTERRPAGNAAALREALNQLRDWALLDINENAIRSDEPNYKKLVDNIIEITNAALAVPPRNCDVGTAEEQLERWESFCGRNWNTNYASRGLDPCDDCKLVEFGNCRCQFLWAQMPCGKEESNG